MRLYFKKSFKLVVKAIKQTFPFQSKKELSIFLKTSKIWEQQLKNIQSNEDFFLFLERYLASLKNSHTKLGNYPTKKFFKPAGYTIAYFNKVFLLIKNKEVVGKVTSIDGFKPKDLLKYHLSRISGSTKQYCLRQALQFILTSDQNKAVKIDLINKNKKFELILPRQLTVLIKQSNVAAKIINQKIGYLKIPNWNPQEITNQLINQKLAWFNRKSIKALIIDVRSNYGGNSRLARGLANHFFDRPVLFGTVKQRLKSNSLGLENIKLPVEPQLPYYSWPIILLVDAGCFSSNEYFIAGLKDNKRAYVIGETTGGGSGNPKKFIIPFKNMSFELLVSTWCYIRPNGQALEGRGISPNLVINQTLEDTIQWKDRILEMGIKRVKI